MRYAWVLLLALLPIAAAAADAPQPEPTPTLASVQQMLATQGPDETLNYLFALPERTDVLLDGIASGDDGWLDMFLPLREASDAFASETLDTAIGYALKPRPERTLGFMNAVSDLERERATRRGSDDNFGRPVYAARVCGNTWQDWQEKDIGAVAPDAGRELDARIAAVRKVTDPTLEAVRRDCLARLEQSREFWRGKLAPR